MTLVVEAMLHEEEWTEVGRLEPGGPAGSLSHNSPDGRDVIQFECFHTMAVIERSLGGADFEVSGGATRAVLAVAGMERLAVLTLAGESYEMDVQTDRMTRPMPFRFRYEATS